MASVLLCTKPPTASIRTSKWVITTCSTRHVRRVFVLIFASRVNPAYETIDDGGEPIYQCIGADGELGQYKRIGATALVVNSAANPIYMQVG